MRLHRTELRVFRLAASVDTFLWGNRVIEGEVSSQGCADETAVLDLAYLARQTLGDAALAAELLGAFEAQTRTILGQLQNFPAPRWRERADQAHLLKGSARAIGAFRMGVLAEQYETLAIDRSEAADGLLRDLVTALAEVSDAIARSLRSVCPGSLDQPANPSAEAPCDDRA